MADMPYSGNVMTTTRWRLYVILHLQQYSRRLNFLKILWSLVPANFLVGCAKIINNLITANVYVLMFTFLTLAVICNFNINDLLLIITVLL